MVRKKKSFNFLFSFSSLNVLLSVPTQVSVLLCPQVCFWKSSILVVTPFDALCLLCFKVLLGPSDNHDSFLVVSLLGWLLPICIAYHLVGNNMREYFMFLKLNSLFYSENSLQSCCNSFTAAILAMCTYTSSPVYHPNFIPLAIQVPHRSLPKEPAAAQRHISRAYSHLADFLTCSICIAPRYHWPDFQ